jgi:hypothetical protein
MGERIKIDPRGFKGPEAGKTTDTTLDRTIKGAEAAVADAQRRAETITKQTNAQIAQATSADQIAKARADAEKARVDLEKAQIDLERLKASGTPLNEGQGKASNFYRRTLSSNLNLDRLALDPDSLIGRTSYDYAPGLTQLASSDKRNAYRSAVENFISATLRLESGAAIGDAEFERQYRIFFPLSGAGPEEIEQKRKARELAISGFKAEAGPGARQAELDLAAQGYEVGGYNAKQQAAGSEVAKSGVAGAGAETTTVEVPKELQSAVMAYVDAKGKDIDAQEFKDFFNKTAEEIGYPNRLSDEEAKRNADAIREGARYGGVTPGDRPLSAVERGVNEFLLSTPGAMATGAFNATTMGLPAMLNEDIGRSTEGVRDENGLAYGIGELAGNLAMTVGGGGLLRTAGMSAPKAEALSDLGYSAITGYTGAEEGERGAGAATNMLLSSLGMAAPSVVKRTLKPSPDEDIRILRDAGVRLSPAQTVGGRVDRTEEAASRALIAGGDMALSTRRRAFNDFNTAYLNSAGKYIGFQLPNDMKPHERMKAIGEAFDNQYDTIRAQMSVAPDQELLDDIADLRSVINDGSTFTSENAGRLNKLLDDQLVRRTANPIGGDEYKSLQSLLKKRKREFTKNDNLELADGVENMQAILDNAARRRSPPEVVQMLDETDRGFALLAQAQEAARMAGNRPGEFSPAQILSRQRAIDTRNRSRSFVEGDMEGQRLAEAGQNVLGNVEPRSGTVERLAALSAAGAAGSLLSPWALLPNAIVGAANAPVVRDVLPAIIAGRRPAPVEALGDLMERYKVPLRYAGAQAGRMLNPLEQTPEDYTMTNIENPIKVTAQSGYPSGLASAEAAAAEAAAAVPVEGPVLMDGRPTEVREDGRRYFVGTNELAEATETYPGDPARGMYRGGTVQAFKNGGNKGTPKKRTSWYDDAVMAVSRRSNDLVAMAADLADKYGISPANATAWIAQNVAGYSPQQAAQIRRNLSGVSNRAIVNAGAASNETRFRNAGGVGARSANEVTPPARLSDIAYRPADVPRAVMSETPKALRAAGNYITSTSPQTMLRDAQRAGSVVIQEVMKDPYGMAFDTALYPAFPVAASVGDLASMRGGSRELAQYAQDNPEAARVKAMVDALAVMPVAGAGGIAGRRLTRKR